MTDSINDLFKVALVGIDAPEIPTWVEETLRREDIAFVARECVTREDLEQGAHDADVVWVFGGSECMKNGNLAVLRKCGAILRTGSGTDNIPVTEATRRGMIVVNTPHALTDEVADHAIGLLMSVIRRIAVHDRLVRDGIWDREKAWPKWHLTGQTLGLVGFGLIARRVTRKMSGFEMKVVAFDPFADEQSMSALNVEKVPLERLVSESHYISVHCPLTDETRHMIGEREFGMMKPTCVLVNTSRGAVIDEGAMIRALRESRIAAAGLDVLENEPPDPENPLLRMNNVVITPHIASYSDLYLDSLWRRSVEAILELRRGYWPPSYVNPDVQPQWDLIHRDRSGAKG